MISDAGLYNKKSGAEAASRPCPVCGSSVPAGRKFCPDCGAKQPELRLQPPNPPAPKFCPNCGSPIVSGTKFCGDCGQNFVQPGQVQGHDESFRRDIARLGSAAKLGSTRFAGGAKKELVRAGSGTKTELERFGGGVRSRLPHRGSSAVRSESTACPACGASILQGLKFCSECGFKQPTVQALSAQPPAVAPKFCAKCGADITRGAKYCPACGNNVTESPAPAIVSGPAPQQVKPERQASAESPARNGDGSELDRILKLKELLDQGLITREEFELQKNSILHPGDSRPPEVQGEGA